MLKIRFAADTDRIAIDQITKEFDDRAYPHASSYFDEVIKNQKILVAVEDAQIIGYLIYHIIWGNTPFVELIYVTKEYQRIGVGLQLLTDLERKLKTLGYTVVISSSEQKNEIGNTFHKKHGFESIGTLDMIYGKEAYYKKKI